MQYRDSFRQGNISFILTTNILLHQELSCVLTRASLGLGDAGWLPDTFQNLLYAPAHAIFLWPFIRLHPDIARPSDSFGIYITLDGILKSTFMFPHFYFIITFLFFFYL